MENKNNMKKIVVIVVFLLLVLVYFLSNKNQSVGVSSTTYSGRALLWKVQAIDTMKYSRDVAREKNTDASFDQTIENQVRRIAQTGATHIAVATPYEEEFLPFMRRWVRYARKYDLLVWFRGNSAGWEGWFEYKKNTPEEHTKQIVTFITKHPDLFEDGDIFSSCPECENGAIGDPRHTGKVDEYREFLISDYQQVKEAFRTINKQVMANYYSMNGDVANLIMNQSTTKALDGVVVVDHYVKSPEKLNNDVTALAEKSGGKVVLGEWGAPIPDIHGKMTEVQQSEWIGEALNLLSKNKNLVGLNYWTSVGGSTSIWTSSTHATLAVRTLTDYFTPQVISGVVTNELDNNINGATVSVGDLRTKTDYLGKYTISVYPGENSLLVSAEGYDSKGITLTRDNTEYNVVLSGKKDNIVFRLSKAIKDFLASFTPDRK